VIAPIRFVRLRRAQASRNPWDSLLTEWAAQHRQERAERAANGEKGWPALRRWLPSGRAS